MWRPYRRSKAAAHWLSLLIAIVSQVGIKKILPAPHSELSLQLESEMFLVDPMVTFLDDPELFVFKIFENEMFLVGFARKVSVGSAQHSSWIVTLSIFSGGLIRNWKRRYFVIDKGVAYYFASSAPKETSLGLYVLPLFFEMFRFSFL